MQSLMERQAMFTAAMWGTIQEAGEAVLALTDSLAEAELLGSRLTRAEVQRQLKLLASTLRSLPASARAAMPGIDWAGWRGMAVALEQEGPARDEALWFGVHHLVPSTLACLRADPGARLHPLHHGAGARFR